MKFTSTLALLTLLLPTGVLADFRNLRSKVNTSKEARSSLADALLSAIRSPQKEVDENLLRVAEMAGLGRESVRHMARTLTKKMESEGASPEVLENQIQRLRESPVQEKPTSSGKSYKPKGAWTYSYQATRALSKAVLSSMRSEDGSVDPKLMDEALTEGVSAEDIERSVASARRLKKKHSATANNQESQSEHASYHYKYADENEEDRQLKQTPSSASVVLTDNSNSQSTTVTVASKQETDPYEYHYADENEVAKRCRK
eukprot:CAMPEP_0178928712 /NCGR_PEP_ID=MMETSP0786-20121207/20087_1 /TAXON_ID=186022 /ORGANISM="Thalassionema frauenfeldii, Strain CCMP 1798" /LENGTH=258 /DNA_ID=CAMNT_0020604669 /DNA_START=30 /DNA_END=806 /DNA_ORIENTATION=-